MRARGLGPAGRVSARARASVVIVALLVAAGAVGAWAAAAAQAPRFTSVASVLIRDYGLDGPAGTDEVSVRRFRTNSAFLAGSQGVLQAAAVRLGRPAGDWAALRADVAVGSREDADVLDVVGSGRTPADATRVADTVAGEFVRYFRARFADLPAGLSPDGRRTFDDLRTLERLEPAAELLVTSAPATRADRGPLRSGLAGGVAGLVAGLLVAAWRHRGRRPPAGVPPVARPGGRSHA